MRDLRAGGTRRARGVPLALSLALALTRTRTRTLTRTLTLRQLETLAAFDAAAAWAAAEGSVTAQHVEEAQLQCFKGLDAPRAPSARGWGRFAQPQLTDDARQAFRERLLDTTPADLRAVAAQYLAAPPTPAAECIVGNAAAVGVDAGDGWAVLGPDLQPLGKQSQYR